MIHRDEHGGVFLTIGMVSNLKEDQSETWKLYMRGSNFLVNGSLLSWRIDGQRGTIRIYKRQCSRSKLLHEGRAGVTEN